MQGEASFWGVAACAEFPNDNPGLHAGAIWTCAFVVGPPSVELQEPARPGFEIPDRHDQEDDTEDAAEPIEIVDEMSLDGAVDESEPASWAAESASDDSSVEDPRAPEPMTADGEPVTDPFARLVIALEETAATLGGGPDQLACIRGLFGVTRWDGVEPGAAAIEALLTTQILVAGESRVTRADGLARGREFTEQVLAWQGILRGESEDFALCTALDEWAADVLARVMGNPGRAEGIRRELRRRGVAAFGLVADAA